MATTIPNATLLIAAIIMIVIGVILLNAPIPYELDIVGSIIFWIGIILLAIWLILFIVYAIKAA